MKNKTKLKISTPNGTFFDQEVEIVTVKTTEGYIGLQYNHIPFVSTISISPMFIKVDENTNKVAAIGGGIVFVERTYIDIFTDDIEWKENIVASITQQQIDEATKKINDAKQEATEKHKNELALKKALNRLETLNTK